MERDSFSCCACGDKESTLNVHHIRYHKEGPWAGKDSDKVTLCEDCHSRAEKAKHDFEELFIFAGAKNSADIMNALVMGMHELLSIDSHVNSGNILWRATKYSFLSTIRSAKGINADECDAAFCFGDHRIKR